MQKNLSIREISMMAICVAFCAVSAYISFPLPFTPGLVTAVTIALSVTAFLFSPKKTFIVIAVYLLIGAIGLPVFAGGKAGLGSLISATGGFYLAWLAAYPLVSKFKGEHPDLKKYVIADVIFGMPVTYLGGIITLMIFMEISFWQAFLIGALPYIIGDVIKCIFAAFLAIRIQKYLNR